MEQRSVNDIRQDVKRNIGKEVILKADMGRKRIKTKTGVLTSTVELISAE